MKELDKIVLPRECVLVKRDKPLEKTASGIFLGEDSAEKIDTGTIVKVGLDHIVLPPDSRWSPIGQRVRFKEAFAEPLLIDNEEYLFFRELEPSIYYYINEEN